MRIFKRFHLLLKYYLTSSTIFSIYNFVLFLPHKHISWFKTGNISGSKVYSTKSPRSSLTCKWILSPPKALENSDRNCKVTASSSDSCQTIIVLIVRVLSLSVNARLLWIQSTGENFCWQLYKPDEASWGGLSSALLGKLVFFSSLRFKENLRIT